MYQAKLTDEQLPHPDDARVFALLEIVAFRVAHAHDIPLEVFEHKHSPLSDGEKCTAWPDEKRISIAVRIRLGDAWFQKARGIHDLLHAVAVALTMLQHPEQPDEIAPHVARVQYDKRARHTASLRHAVSDEYHLLTHGAETLDEYFDR